MCYPRCMFVILQNFLAGTECRAIQSNSRGWGQLHIICQSICPQWIVIGYLLDIFALLFFLKEVFIYVHLKYNFSILHYDCKYDWNFTCVYLDYLDLNLSKVSEYIFIKICSLRFYFLMYLKSILWPLININNFLQLEI